MRFASGFSSIHRNCCSIWPGPSRHLSVVEILRSTKSRHLCCSDFEINKISASLCFLRFEAIFETVSALTMFTLVVLGVVLKHSLKQFSIDYHE